MKQLSSFILPVTVLAIVPYLIESRWKITVDIFSITGFLFSAFGLMLLIVTVSMFIRIGRGTHAPWSPTSRLITGGVYAHTRNPMINGVLIILIGESLFFYSLVIFIWAVLFFIVNNVYFAYSEEPGLTRKFGREYIDYKDNVPRWLPRLTPWKPPVSKNII